MSIIRIESENFKRITLAEIPVTGPVTIIGGLNGQGKSSALDTFEAVVGGEKSVPEKPVHTGAEYAEGRIYTSDGLKFRKRLVPGKPGRLEVSTAEGATFKSPQAMADKMFGRFGLDPLAFTRKKKEEKLELVRKLAGVDFTLLDAQRAELYDKRTIVGKELDRLKATAEVDRLTERLAAMPYHEGLPAEPTAMGALLAELRAAQEENRAREARRATLRASLGEGAELEAKIRDGEGKAGAIQAQIADLEKRLAELKGKLGQWKEYLAKKHEELAAFEGKAEAVRAEVAAIVDVDLGPLQERMDGLEEENRLVRENQARAALAAQVEAKKAEHAAALEAKKAERDALTKQIDAIDAQKQKVLSEAHFPIEGLSFDENGLTFRGEPFEQASSAEQLRVATAIAFALSGTCKVALIRDGSLLDDESLRLLSDFAEAEGGQVFIERVGADGNVIIEDGHIATPAEVERIRQRLSAAFTRSPLDVLAEELAKPEEPEASESAPAQPEPAAEPEQSAPAPVATPAEEPPSELAEQASLFGSADGDFDGPPEEA